MNLKAHLGKTKSASKELVERRGKPEADFLLAILESHRYLATASMVQGVSYLSSWQQNLTGAPTQCRFCRDPGGKGWGVMEVYTKVPEKC